MVGSVRAGMKAKCSLLYRAAVTLAETGARGQCAVCGGHCKSQVPQMGCWLGGD